jgi:hypothetical protein
MEPYLTYLTIVVALIALALTAQAVILFLLYVKITPLLEDARELRWQIIDLYERFLPILRDAQETTTTIKEGARRVLGDIAGVSGDLRRKVAKVDRLTDRLAGRVRDALNGSALKKGLVAPLREATALLRGVKAGVGSISGRRNRGRYDRAYGPARTGRPDRPEQGL